MATNLESSEQLSSEEIKEQEEIIKEIKLVAKEIQKNEILTRGSSLPMDISNISGKFFYKKYIISKL